MNGKKMAALFGSAIVLSALETAPAEGQSRPPEPFPTTNPVNNVYLLSNELERQYQSFNGDCGLPVPLRLRRNRGAASAVDPAIIRALNLTSTGPTTARPVGASLGTAFRHVWTQAEEQQLNPNWVTERNLPIDPAHLGVDPVVGLPSVVEFSTCGSVVGGNISGRLDSPPFPVATVTAALQVETRRDRQVRMIVMNGEFVNPLWQMWIGGNVDESVMQAEKIIAGLIFWEWRARAAASQNDARLLTQFNGTHIFRSLRSGAQLTAEASVEARASYFIASVDAQASAQTNQETQLTLSDYRLVIGMDGARRQASFADLPSAPAIAAEVARAELRVEFQNGNNQIVAEQPIVFDLLFPRLPPAFCVNGAWEIRNGAGENNGYSFESPPVVDQAANACRFEVRFRPENRTAAVAGLSPVLTSRSALVAGGSAPQEVRLQVPFRPNLRRLPAPELQFQSSAPFTTTPVPGIPPRTNVTIRNSFLARSMTNYENDLVNADDVILTCPEGLNGAHPMWTATITGTGANRTFDLTGNSFYNGTITQGAPTQTCTLSGAVSVRRSNTEDRVPVPLGPIQVAYPRPPLQLAPPTRVRVRTSG